MKLLIFIILISIISSWAQADCISPAGKAGQAEWISSSSKIMWCNDTNWVDPVVTPALSCSGTAAGTINYSSGDLQFCDGSFWQSMKGNTLDSCVGYMPGTFQWDSSRFLMKFCDGSWWYTMYSPTPPSVSSIGINGGDTFTRLNNVQMNLSASVADSASKITHFCFKYSTSGTPPTAPGVNDSCWLRVDFPSPGIQPESSISFSNFYFSIGFTPATYTVFGWGKTGADVISSLSNSGAGTTSVDMASINFDPGAPPTLINISSTNTDSPSIPPVNSDLVIGAGADVYIKWKLTDDRPLPATPVDIFYTTDEVNFTLVASSVTNTANTGCTVDGTNHTGCYRWVGGAPSSGYFKIRVKATDDANLSSISSAEPNNMGIFKYLAGTTDPGLGGSAASAVMYSRQTGQFNSGGGCFVVRDNGMMFLCDSRGLMVIDPNDGTYKVLLPYTGARTDGPISSATLVGMPVKIALDYNDRLLIFDNDRIRRVDFTTNTVSSFIGGGASTADGTLATNFQVSPPPYRHTSALFVPLPNGDIWFQSGVDHNTTARSVSTKVRIYKASDNRVYEWVPTGIGSLEDASFDPSGYAVYNIGLSFDPLTSEVTSIRSRSIIPVSGGHAPRSVSYNPTTGETTSPHVRFLGYWTDDNTINSRTGEMYGAELFGLYGLFKYNSGTNNWDQVLGTGSKGQCVDGTPALSCSVEIQDAYINAQNQIFFIDRNRIRTIDDSGNVLTIFGQSLSFGDGGIATSARINDVLWLDITAGGKVAFVDNKEFVMREFTPSGTIQKIAGNGADAVPDTTNLAVNQPISANYWGGIYPMMADQTTGDIFFTRNGTQISKLDRSSGLWVDIAGGGGTSYKTADGLLGNQVAMEGYQMAAIGYSGTTLLRHLHNWDGTQLVDSFIKSYAVSDGTQGAFAGVLGPVGSSIDNCADGVALSSCALPSNRNTMSKAFWDSANSRWLLHQVGSNIIRTAVAGGNWGTLAVLPRGFNAFTYVLKSSVPHVYYCSAGRMYKYNLSTSTETTLFWPSSTISCQGYSIAWHAGRNSIVFAIKQNGLGAIAEINDP